MTQENKERLIQLLSKLSGLPLIGDYFLHLQYASWCTDEQGEMSGKPYGTFVRKKLQPAD